MSKKTPIPSKKKIPASVPGFVQVESAGGITEFLLKSNGLRVLYLNRPKTGVITTNITYLVGARDETRGETGLAHMLEHMLFKPTVFDIKAGIDSGAMQFERDTGCVLNANTWKDRTTYYFSYPKEYFNRALKIEAERMTGVVLTDESLNPERNNVLSEHDMYNGDPYFALNVAMVGAAYHSHPYGHETIGHREDIEDYTAATLERFYRFYYRPDNAVMMVVGDIDEKTALTAIKKHFGSLEKPTTPIPRFHIREPKQEGLRRTTIARPSETNVVALGIKQKGFPSQDWFATSVLFEILTGGPESILHRALIDTGIATSVDGSLEPASEENLATLTITLAKKQEHQAIEEKVLRLIADLNTTTVTPLLKKVKARMLTDELFARDSSLRITQELTEYTSAGDWTQYTKTIKLLEAITPKTILETAKHCFNPDTMTIGYFIGTKK
jgi:zinc protease